MLNTTSVDVGPTLGVKSDWWPGKSHTGFHRQLFELNPISVLCVNAWKLVDQWDIRKRHEFCRVSPKVNQAFWSPMMNVSAKFEVNHQSSLSRNVQNLNIVMDKQKDNWVIFKELHFSWFMFLGIIIRHIPLKFQKDMRKDLQDVWQTYKETCSPFY